MQGVFEGVGLAEEGEVCISQPLASSVVHDVSSPGEEPTLGVSER